MRLEIKDLRVHYGKIEAIKGVSVVVNQGEIVTLIGANGAGKTTILKTISGLRPVSSGDITFDGVSINKIPAHERVDLGISQVPEGRGIFPGMTVLENLEIGKFNRKDRKAEMAEDLDRVYTLFPRLEERTAQAGGTLSGGEQQMLAMGRALMARPKVLLLDEPFGALDIQIRESMQEFLHQLWRQTGLTALLITHDLEEALLLASRVHIMAPSPGRIVRTVDVDLDRSAMAHLRVSPQFLDLREELARCLRGLEPALAR